MEPYQNNLSCCKLVNDILPNIFVFTILLQTLIQFSLVAEQQKGSP